MTESEAPLSELWREALLKLSRSRVRPRLRAALVLYGQGEPARPTAFAFGYQDHRPITRGAREYGFDVLHRLSRDLRDYERLVAMLGIETPPELHAKRLALSVETALLVTPTAPARAR
jgi:hypothetical protein